MAKATVLGSELEKARKRLGWTQEELSKKCGVNVSTIYRLERDKPTRIRASTLERLSAVMGVRPSDLTQKAAPEPERDFMKVRIGSAARNALALVASRYRVPRERIIEIAPLLFLVAAEASLLGRRANVRELRAAENAVYEAAIPHLYRTAAVDAEAVELEEKSIAARDLFAELVEDRGSGNDDSDYDRSKDNPFARYLSQLLNEVVGSDERVEPVHWGARGGPSYQICTEEALRLTGGDEEAAKAILSGDAALHERPKPANSEQIAEWAKAERDRAANSAAELLASLGIAVSDGEKQ